MSKTVPQLGETAGDLIGTAALVGDHDIPFTRFFRCPSLKTRDLTLSIAENAVKKQFSLSRLPGSLTGTGLRISMCA
jgi:hypothetical protein